MKYPNAPLLDGGRTAVGSGPLSLVSVAVQLLDEFSFELVERGVHEDLDLVCVVNRCRVRSRTPQGICTHHDRQMLMCIRVTANRA